MLASHQAGKDAQKVKDAWAVVYETGVRNAKQNVYAGHLQRLNLLASEIQFCSARFREHMTHRYVRSFFLRAGE